MNKLKRIIEIKKEKMVLESVRSILLKQSKKSYYDNGANICELVPLQEYKYDMKKKAFHIVNMSIYYNDMVRFNDFWLSFTGLDEPVPPYKINKVLSKRK